MAAHERTSIVRPPSVVARTALFELLSAGHEGGLTLISAPAGSGKTVLLRSWVGAAGLSERTAWVSVERGERDEQRFWLAVVEALRTAAGMEGPIDDLGPAPGFDSKAVVERIVDGARSLDRPILLVIDDLHHLVEPGALSSLGLLLDRRPPQLRVVLSTRHDPPLGLHRVRLAGELTELRATDLRFGLDETNELLSAAGITLSAAAVGSLQARTEGWVAGLRLAALSLAGRPDPERFIAEFSGSERTVADYLFAEVLQREPEPVRQLLLRTSILERVNGPIADSLLETEGSERSCSSSKTPGPSSTPSTGSGPGSATTTSSRISCVSSFGAPSRLPFPVCTASPPSGMRSTGSPLMPSGTPRPPGIGGMPATSSGSSGSASRSTAVSRRCVPCSSGSPRKSSPIRNSPRFSLMAR